MKAWGDLGTHLEVLDSDRPGHREIANDLGWRERVVDDYVGDVARLDRRWQEESLCAALLPRDAEAEDFALEADFYRRRKRDWNGRIASAGSGKRRFERAVDKDPDLVVGECVDPADIGREPVGGAIDCAGARQHQARGAAGQVRECGARNDRLEAHLECSGDCGWQSGCS